MPRAEWMCRLVLSAVLILPCAKALSFDLGSVDTNGGAAREQLDLDCMIHQHADHGQEVARGRRCCSPLVDYPLYLLVL